MPRPGIRSLCQLVCPVEMRDWDKVKNTTVIHRGQMSFFMYLSGPCAVILVHIFIPVILYTRSQVWYIFVHVASFSVFMCSILLTLVCIYHVPFLLDHCLSFSCPLSFSYCIACPSNYGWLLLWYNVEQSLAVPLFLSLIQINLT